MFFSWLWLVLANECSYTVIEVVQYIFAHLNFCIISWLVICCGGNQSCLHVKKNMQTITVPIEPHSNLFVLINPLFVFWVSPGVEIS